MLALMKIVNEKKVFTGFLYRDDVTAIYYNLKR